MLEIIFGYSIRGTTPVCHHFLTRGKRVNSIATTALVALNLTCNTVNQDVFFHFLRGYLIPQLRPLMVSTKQSSQYTTYRKSLTFSEKLES